MEIFRWVLIAVSLILIALLVRHTIRRARTLSERIDEYHEEQEAQAKQPGPVNPYENMGQLFGVKPESEEKKQDEAE